VRRHLLFMNVLSLFDGMSCGQQALERSGIVVDNYFASEIDKHAIQVTMANYPNTKQLGSVVNVDGYSLPKIDLLIGGSPCQSFSFAGKRKGMATKCEIEILTLEHYLELKAEGYEFEGQSYLFWEFMRLLNECKPTYFLLENVEMGEKWEKVLSKAIGVNGIHINSALVSAQNRKRIYWTNIGMQPSGLFGDLESIIEKPKDKGILLKDILESEVDDKYYLKQKAIDYINRDKRNLAFQMDEKDNKSICITAVFAKQIPYNQIIVHNTMPRSSKSGKGGTGPLSRADGKTYCLDTGNTNAVEIVAMRGRGEKGNIKQQLEYNGTNKSNSLTTVTKDNLLMLNENQLRKFNHDPDIEKANTLTLAQGRAGSSEEYMDAVSKIAKIQGIIRRLTPIECERLQTVKDNYTDCVSDTQRYRMLGNGWTVDVIAHILSYAKFNYTHT
jgi:DNA-cytosine methyltransferase